MSRTKHKKVIEERNNISRLIAIAGVLTIFPFSIFSRLIFQFLIYDSLEYNLAIVAILSAPKIIGLLIYCCTPISKIRGVGTMSVLSFIVLVFIAFNLFSALNATGWDGIGYATLAYGGFFLYYPLVIILLAISFVRLYHPKKYNEKASHKKEKEYKDDLL